MLLQINKSKKSDKNRNTHNLAIIDETPIAPSTEVQITAAEAERLLKEAKRKERERKALRLKRSKNISAPKTVQNHIRYEAMYEDGICLIRPGKYSSTLAFTGINYRYMNNREEEQVFELWCEMLNYFDPSVDVQFSIFNSKPLEDEKENILIDEPQKDDGLNWARKEFNNEVLIKNVVNAISDRDLEYYVTFGVDAATHKEAFELLTQIENEIIGSLAKLQSEARRLNGLERLRLLNKIFWPDDVFLFNYKALMNNSMRTKDAICPMAITVPRVPTTNIQFGDTVASCLTLTAKTGWPSDLSDKLIGDLSLLDEDMVINFHLKSVAQDEALDIVNSKLINMSQERFTKRKKAIASNFDPDEMVPMELRDRIEDAEQYRKDLKQRNQKMLRGTFLVWLYANDEKKLQRAEQRVINTARKNSYRLTKISTKEPLLDALNSTLPLGQNYTKVKRTLTTAAAGVITPFSELQLQHQDGLYYGLEDTSKKYITINRNLLNNRHGIYVGGSGSGKSFAVKREIVQLLMKNPNAEVWISDPDNEYRPYIELLGGNYYNCKSGSTDYINPCEIYPDENNNWPIADRAQFLMGLAEEVYKTDSRETAFLRSLIDRCTTLMYQPYITGKTNKQPTLQDLFFVLRNQEEQLAKDFSLVLETYVEGSMNQFAHEAVQKTGNRINGIGFKEAGKIYRSFAQHIITDTLWNRMLLNDARGVDTYLYFDEFHTSLKNKTQSEYFLDIWARSRKMSGACTGITQVPDTLLENEDASKMLKNTPFVAMYEILDPDGLAELFNMSGKQIKYIKNPKQGSGLYRIQGMLVPFIDQFPSDTELYRVMTTKPEDRGIRA